MSKELVKFDFTGSDLFGELSKEDFEKEMNKGSRGFEPGTYSVEIVKAEFNVNKETGSIYSAKDPTWLNVKLTLSSGGKEKDMYLLVPTSKLTYNEANSKGPTFVWQKFRQFMAGIGEHLESDGTKLKAVIPKMFSNPSKTLVGKTLTIVIGFKGNYVAYKGKDQYQLKDKDGELLSENIFESVEEAQEFASEHDIQLVKSTNNRYYPEILNVLAKKKDEADKADGPDFGF